MTKDAVEQPPKTQSLHPAYSVTNIQSKIRTLDGTNVTYSQWIRLFRLHAVAYKVMDHIDGTAPPPPPASSSAGYEVWKEIDVLALQWIFGTLSDALLKRVMDGSTVTAHVAWSKLEKIYLSNKKACAASLETKFCNLSLSACSSVDAYCQQLTDLANQMADVDVPVTKSRLVLQLVRGLPAEFNTTASLINQNDVDWDQAVSMLQDEVLRLDAQKDSHATVLAATSSQTTPPNNQQTPSSDPNSSSTRGKGRGRGSWNRRGGRGRGGSNRQNWSGQQQQQSGFSLQPGYPNWAGGHLHLAPIRPSSSGGPISAPVSSKQHHLRLTFPPFLNSNSVVLALHLRGVQCLESF
uniref:uncharacterized protein LOC122591897 n=1 Tax=Erigeron canadensis TaxID=72917 RepID=UPI001CB8A065|nr:uncharacterized protein LOC122591897 [Erigeron canadensis]